MHRKLTALLLFAATLASAPLAAGELEDPTQIADHRTLVERANLAFREGRLVAPAGENALELFLAARDEDPRHVGANEAIVDLFPIAISAAESRLAARETAEAARILALIDRAMPNSIAVSALRTRIERAAPAAPAAAVAAAALQP